MKVRAIIAAAVLASAGIAIPFASPASASSACYGQTDQPHYSSHVPGSVNVVARTGCPGGWVYVEVSLYRERWYGEQFLASNSATGEDYVQTNAAWTCQGTGTYTYDAYSYHTAQLHGPLNTGNSARFTC